MVKVSVCRDIEKCRELWEMNWPKTCLFDLWPVRQCFARHYSHPAEFYTAGKNGELAGMLPLSRIDETGCYVFFPGELWQGRTWLEQNKIVSSGPRVTEALLESVPKPVHLRYLHPEYVPGMHDGYRKGDFAVDETGYLFFPARYGYAFDAYMKTFSARSRKKLARERESIEGRGLRYRFDHLPDMERLFQLNLSVFGDRSYFHDSRFLNSFVALAEWLKAHRMLCITTLLLGEEVAAVDMGALWNSQYTVLAGGAHPAFPGVAKVINFHHIRRACDQRLALVDFLCGDFGWKKRFHLQPRPLYLTDISADAWAGRKASSNI